MFLMARKDVLFCCQNTGGTTHEADKPQLIRVVAFCVAKNQKEICFE